MALTWNDARGKVRGDLWRPGVSGIPDDVCDRALHASLLRLEGVRAWSWLEGISVPLVLIADATTIPLPTNCRSLVSLSYQRVGGAGFDILTRQALPIVRADVSDGGRYPEAYSIQGGLAHLDAVAPAGSTFQFIFTASTPDDLDAAVAAAANVTLQRQQTAIIAAACAHIAGTYLKNEAEEARQERAYQRIEDCLSDVEDETRGDAYGGRVRPDPFMVGGSYAR